VAGILGFKTAFADAEIVNPFSAKGDKVEVVDVKVEIDHMARMAGVAYKIAEKGDDGHVSRFFDTEEIVFAVVSEAGEALRYGDVETLDFGRMFELSLEYEGGDGSVRVVSGLA